VLTFQIRPAAAHSASLVSAPQALFGRWPVLEPWRSISRSKGLANGIFSIALLSTYAIKQMQSNLFEDMKLDRQARQANGPWLRCAKYAFFRAEKAI
jgi:hypothetical protein